MATSTNPPYGIADIWVGGSERHGWTKANAEEFDKEYPFDAASSPSKESK